MKYTRIIIASILIVLGAFLVFLTLGVVNEEVIPLYTVSSNDVGPAVTGYKNYVSPEYYYGYTITWKSVQKDGYKFIYAKNLYLDGRQGQEYVINNVYYTIDPDSYPQIASGFVEKYGPASKLIAWQRNHDTDQNKNILVANFAGEADIADIPNSNSNAQAVFTGITSSSFFTVWQGENNYLYAKYLYNGPDIPATILHTNTSSNPQVAYSAKGDDMIVTWLGEENFMYYLRFELVDFSSIDPNNNNARLLGSGSGQNLHVAFGDGFNNERRFFIIWQRIDDNNLGGAIINPSDGEIIQTNERLLTTGMPNIHNLKIFSVGRNLLLLWHKFTDSGDVNVYGFGISQNFDTLQSDPQLIATIEGEDINSVDYHYNEIGNAILIVYSKGKVADWAADIYGRIVGQNLVPDPDSDNDDILDTKDNCPFISNRDQTDTDADGVGDICDNCRLIKNPDQSDFDHNGIGDKCSPIRTRIKQRL